MIGMDADFKPPNNDRRGPTVIKGADVDMAETSCRISVYGTPMAWLLHLRYDLVDDVHNAYLPTSPADLVRVRDMISTVLTSNGYCVHAVRIDKDCARCEQEFEIRAG